MTGLVSEQRLERLLSKRETCKVCFRNMESQAITIEPLSDKYISQMPIVITATASSGLPVIFGSIGSHCAVSGPAGAILLGMRAGSCTGIAIQSGNALHAAAPSVSRTFTILPQVFVPNLMR